MRIPIHQVDAFTTRAFGGNPAAVCPLEDWLPDETLQAIALENNLSETAFLVPTKAGYDLRWFTPAVEVDLCGHATLAAARIVFDRLRPGTSAVQFSTRSGELAVKRKGDLLEMDFPSQPGEPCDAGPLGPALGRAPVEARRSVNYYLAAFEAERDVREVVPDERALLALDRIGVIATAPGEDDGVDFVSRFFAPRAGILEDPVTGSAHCVSTPYWAERLGKSKLEARQISARGGELTCEARGDRVGIAGSTVVVLEGELILP